VAIKVFFKESSDDTKIGTLSEFVLNQQLRSLRSASRVIVKLIEVFEEDSFAYLVTTWMPRGDVHSIMSRKNVGYLTEGEMRGQLTIVADALSQIHDLGYTHNAVKPENIFLEKKNRVRLGGFSKSSQA
jgi:serine/threonine protein kinase